MITFVTIASGTLGVACFAFMPLTERWSVREFLFWLGVGLVLLAASFAALRENHKRRRRDKLGEFIERAKQLGMLRTMSTSTSEKQRRKLMHSSSRRTDTFETTSAPEQ
ncbi:MAG: hypothetical protein M3R49_10120 [Chloroflexota bacterium]|nr:hypothetical protein [Chloroflexota bacterium]